MDGIFEKKIYLTGFNQDDLFSGISFLGELGWTGESDSSLCSYSHKTPVCHGIRVVETENLSALKALKSDRPSDRFIAFVNPGDRIALSSISPMSDVKLIFWPLEKKETRKVLGSIEDNIHAFMAEQLVFQGLNNMEAAWSWKSSDFSVSRVSRYLARELTQAGYYGTMEEEEFCALALEEALVNSLEHGNLELSSSWRADDLEKFDEYEHERTLRLKDPVFGDRLVKIRLSINEESASLTLEDEGPGFDTSKLEALLKPTEMDVSGKGIFLIKRAFETIEYLGRGNILQLTKSRSL